MKPFFFNSIPGTTVLSGDLPKKTLVILSDSEESSSTSMAAIQGEEDASYLPMT